MHIVFVDNHEFERILMRVVAKRFPGLLQLSEVDGATGLFELLRELTAPPDLIFMDYDMPGKDGVECLRELRNNSRFRDIPVIMYANLATAAQVNAAQQSGADYYLVKPFDIKDIQAIFEWCLKRKPARNAQDGKENFLLYAHKLPPAL